MGTVEVEKSDLQKISDLSQTILERDQTISDLTQDCDKWKKSYAEVNSAKNTLVGENRAYQYIVGELIEKLVDKI